MVAIKRCSTLSPSGVTFSAVLASNDESALGALQALKEAGRRIPHDVALIGFDDRPESAIQIPALSSVQIPLFKLGYQAVEVMLQHIDQRSDAPQLIRVPTRLVKRESCGCGHRTSHSAQRAPALRTGRERSGGRASTSLRSAQHASAAQSKNASDPLPQLIDTVSREAQHTSAGEIQRSL